MRSFLVNTFFLLSLSLSLCAQKGHSTLFGHNDALLYGRYWSDSPQGRAGKKKKQLQPDVYQVCKAYPGLLSTDFDGLELGRDIYWGGVTFDKMRTSIIRQHKSGGMITISWHVRNPEHGLGYFYKDEHKGTVARILRLEGPTYQTFMLYMSRVADFLLTLRDEEGQLIPIVFRPWHECNGNWFWWGTDDCSPEEYVRLWRMTRDYLTSRGLTNLLYCFSPGAWFNDEKDYMQRFPGRDYVDVIGIECYRQKEFGVEEARRRFYVHMQKNLKIAKHVADEFDMPYAVTETGMNPDSDSQWWTKGLMPSLEGYSPIFVNCWSNQWIEVPKSGACCTYPGEASAKDFRKFYKKNKKMFIKKLKNL